FIRNDDEVLNVGSRWSYETSERKTSTVRASTAMATISFKIVCRTASPRDSSKGEPSTKQKFSESSSYVFLHEGQRFIFLLKPGNFRPLINADGADQKVTSPLFEP